MPIAGLMSDQSGEWWMKNSQVFMKSVYRAWHLRRSGTGDDIMFYVPGSDSGDQTDRYGLFDVTTFSFIPVEISRQRNKEDKGMGNGKTKDISDRGFSAVTLVEDIFHDQ